jgi:hypothetical protein
MFVTNHVLAGATIGSRLARRPAVAFAAGLVSHFVMDACPHWGVAGNEPDARDQFLRLARRDGCIGLVALGAGAVLADGTARRSVLFAMIGAALPDLDKPCVHFFGVNPFPSWFQRFHGRIQRESPHLVPREILIGCGLAASAALGLRGQHGGPHGR